MNISPAFQFYTKDWLSSANVQLMTPAQEGAYIRLLAFCWESGDCSLPDDDQQLAVLSRMNEGWLNGGCSLVRKCFIPHPTKPGCLTNQRMLNEADKQAAWRKKSAEGGRKSAKQRTGKQEKFKGGSSVVEDCLQPNGNSSSSSSSSSIDSGTKVPSSPPTPKKPPKVSLAELSVDHVRDWLAEKRVQGKYLAHDEHFILEQFKNYCLSKGKHYADYVAGYRNAFEWDRCQPHARTAQAARGTSPGEPPKSKWDIEAERIAAKWIDEARRNGEAVAPQDSGHGEQAPEAVRADRG